ncbi:MAG TPA: molybdopterin-dependent oxidoreductase [Bryobacteraceae bacterium]|nr:molybdopterin-dependent oxidoreductase [Bryobacteraceae bacterium]
MDNQDISRRTILKGGGAAFTAMTTLRVTTPAPAFGQAGEEVIPWLDTLPPPPPSDVNDNLQPWEKLDSWITPAERFFNVNHYGQPDSLDESAWRVGITGLVARPRSLTIADLKARERREVDFTLECSGDNGFDWFSSAIGNARWAGTPLAPLLEQADVLRQASEVVFYGVDRGTATIRDNGGILTPGQTGEVQPDSDGGLDLTITEQFARSMSIDEALNRDNLLCYEMNGQPLPPQHGFPVRLIAPGWYGVANVKWLTRIEVLDRRHAGRFMSRDYINIREEQRDGQTVWTFTTVGPIRLKSAPARVTRQNGQYTVKGAAWGAPISGVEVQIDDGPWHAAALDSPAAPAGLSSQAGDKSQANMLDSSISRGNNNSRGYAWRFWSFKWEMPASGKHTVRSRAFDVNGNIQPAPDDPFLASKRTYWESNGQITRQVLIP